MGQESGTHGREENAYRVMMEKFEGKRPLG
jgi:hypothetical protein